MKAALIILAAYVSLQALGRFVCVVGLPPWRSGRLYFLAALDGLALFWAGVAALL